MQRGVWTLLVSAFLAAMLAASGARASDVRPAARHTSQGLMSSGAAVPPSSVAALAEIDEDDDEVALSPEERRRITGGGTSIDRGADLSAALDVEPPAAPARTERFAESEATLVEAAPSDPKTCPRWGQLKKADGEPPVPRMGGFGFIMRNNAGVAQFVVGAGVKRSGSLVRKIRYMSLGENGASKWVRPAVGRGAGATQVWRNAAAYAWFPSPSLKSGLLFEFGGTAANAQGAVQLVNEPRVLVADAANEAGTFRWAVPTLTDPESKGIKPVARQGATLTPVPGGRAVLFGGADAQTQLADTWMLAVKVATEAGAAPSYTWAEAAAGGASAPPSPRSGHAAAYFERTAGKPESGVVMVFGGVGEGDRPIDDGRVVYMLSTSTLTWTSTTVSNSLDTMPSPREGHTLTVVGRDVYLYGGCDPGTTLGGGGGFSCKRDAWRYSIDTNTWHPLRSADERDQSYVEPPASMGHVAVPWSKQKSVLVFGGGDAGTGQFADAAQPWVLELEGVCPGDCTNGGAFDNGHCNCGDSWTGERCEKLSPDALAAHKLPATSCPNSCSGQGVCVDGGCVCNKGFNGSDCSQRVDCPDCAKAGTGCPNKCSGHGACRTADGTSVCKCADGWTGTDCSFKQCPQGCSGHGECNDVDGVCTCSPGYTGASCNVAVTACPNNCTSGVHGQCVPLDQPGAFACLCNDGFGGPDCSSDVRCPAGMPAVEACNGHGTCAREACVCDVGFAGDRCDQRSCPGDCSGHGACDGKTGACKCGAGFGGEDCARPLTCPQECNKRGDCWEDLEGVAMAPNDGVCRCRSPYEGTACEAIPCPMGANEKACSGRGSCDKANGLCVCESGYAGASCTHECPMQCSGHGNCFSNTYGKAVCDCQPGFRGVGCQIAVACPNNCTENGVCFRGTCLCDPGFTGEDCGKSLCDGMSCGHGRCLNGKCFCEPGYSGDACEQTVACPAGCSGHGKCTNGRCYCDAEWQGKACDVAATCPRECSQRGICIRGSCQCQPGFSGAACETASTSEAGCLGNCTGHGACAVGKCFCNPHWSGRDCSRYEPPTCPMGKTLVKGAVCSNRGFCSNDGVCSCYPGYGGEDCSVVETCPQNCNTHGICFNQRCFCDPGFSGEFCEKLEPCPGTPQCMDRGLCRNGMCVCEPGYGGLDCSSVVIGTDICPNNCTGNGACQVGKCHCYPGFVGDDCSQVDPKTLCPENCGGIEHGTCHLGRCFCTPGWTGPSCQILQPCEAGCSGHGTCLHGNCFCHQQWTGKNCSKMLAAHEMPSGKALKEDALCPNGCSMHGICFKGKCICNPGYQGLDCSRADKTYTDDMACPNDCRGSHGARPAGEFGVCIERQCFCYPGFGGPGCDEIMTLPCPDDCNGRGICSYGKCFCDIGFKGRSCEVKMKCPEDCNGNGVCHRGRCDCNPGFMGKACEQMSGLECKNSCSGHGQCLMGSCFCQPGYEGDDCGILNAVPEEPKGEKPKLPGGPDRATRNSVGAVLTGAQHGSIEGALEHHQLVDRLTIGPTNTGAQFSDTKEVHESIKRGFSEARFREATSSPQCELNCTGNGECIVRDGKQMCDCNPGFRGLHCDRAIDCGAHDCSGHGVCRYGECFCEAGYDGKHCASSLPCQVADCSGRGICQGGKCFCEPGFDGPGCETAVSCPGDRDGLPPCSGHGVCHGGQCFCDDSFEGAACDKPRAGLPRCVLDCSNNGLCKQGRCFCRQGFAGVGCEISLADTQRLAAAAASSAQPTSASNAVRFSWMSTLLVAFAMLAIGAGSVFAGVRFYYRRSSGAADNVLKSQPPMNGASITSPFMLSTEQ